MTTYSWNATDGEWQSAADWTNAAHPSGHAAPTRADDAIVDNGGTVGIASRDIGAVARMLKIDNGALFDSGRLQVDGLQVAGRGGLTVDAGILDVGYEDKGCEIFDLSASITVENFGVLTVGRYLRGDVSGTVTLAYGGEFVFDDPSASSTCHAVVDFANAGGTFVDGAAWGGSIENFNTSNSNALSFGSAVTSFAFDAHTDLLKIHTRSSGNYTLKFADDGTPLTQSNFAIGASPNTIDYSGAAVCFASGTRVRTARGDVAVEALQVGDLALTASGESRPIRWLGHRRVDCRRHPQPADVMPVRIAAHAFGPDKPARDLQVSPGHAICVDIVGEALIPAVALVNGATIRQLDVDEVTYWHVELDSHDIVFAENLAAESYFDSGNRAFFSESEVVNLNLTPEDAKRVHENFCRPFHEAGALVDVVRSQLLARARSLGWTLHRDPLADLHLLVDGRRVDPVVDNRRVRFSVPCGAQEVWLASATARPLDVQLGRDSRTLGVCLAALHIEAGSALREIRLDDPTLGEGFHDVERNGETMWRWTAGRARLLAALWADEAFELTVTLGGEAPPRWLGPSKQPAPSDAARAA